MFFEKLVESIAASVVLALQLLRVVLGSLGLVAMNLAPIRGISDIRG